MRLNTHLSCLRASRLGLPQDLAAHALRLGSRGALPSVSPLEVPWPPPAGQGFQPLHPTSVPWLLQPGGGCLSVSQESLADSGRSGGMWGTEQLGIVPDRLWRGNRSPARGWHAFPDLCIRASPGRPAPRGRCLGSQAGVYLGQPVCNLGPEPFAAGGPAARGKRTQFWKHHLLLPPLCRGGAAMPAAMRFTVLKCAWFLARTTHSLLTATHGAGCSLANTDPKGSPYTQASWFQLYQASACSEQQAAPRRGSGHASPEGDTLWAGPEGSGQVPPLPTLVLGVLCFWGLGTGCGWAQGLRTSK